MGDGNRRSWNLDRLPTNNSLRKWRSVKMFQDFAALSFCRSISQTMLWLASFFFLVWHSSKLGQFYPRIVWYNGRPQKDVVWYSQNMVAQFFDPICRGNRIFGQLSLEQMGGIPISSTLPPADLLVWICQPHFQHLWCDAFNHAGLLTPGKH